MNSEVEELVKLMDDKGIKMSVDYSTVELKFKDGDTITFEAEGPEGSHMEISAGIKRQFKNIRA